MRINDLPTPCYVIDETKLIRNLEILKDVKEKAGCKILLAQKAFSCYHFYPLIGNYLDGTACSGLFEARLGYEEMGKLNHVFSAAYREDEIDEISRLCDHVIFNSMSQKDRFASRVIGSGSKVGIRINPECSTQTGHEIYDPCAAFSRLGVTLAELKNGSMAGVSGFHFHTLCEQDSDALEITLNAIEDKFKDYLERISWLNMGGGHHITRDGYDRERLIVCVKRFREKYGLEIFLEPGEAIALNAGYLITSVLDIKRNGMDIAIVDASAACHMPDVLEMPYTPPLYSLETLEPYEKAQNVHKYRLGAQTCLAGDVIGDYDFNSELKAGDRIVFGDMAIYSMVKNNTFNGMCLPSIALLHKDGECEIIKRFSYNDFKCRL